MRVNRAIEDGSFFENAALVSAFRARASAGGDVHLLGLVSYGGVHSHIDHLRALLELAQREAMAERTWIHAFTDGRDVSPHAAASDLAELPAERIATVVGRYYAMDRDSRWERTERAFAAIRRRRRRGSARSGRRRPGELRRTGSRTSSSSPSSLDRAAAARPGRTRAIFFNFRPDRARQLSQRLLEAGIDLTTMTRYREDFPTAPSRSPSRTSRTRSPRCSRRSGLRQLHVAETEKYAHVTYFFNGGEEREWEGETRILVPSPRDVPELRPEAGDVGRTRSRARFCDEIGRGYAFARRELREPRHGRATRGRSRRSSRRSRRRTRASARSSSASHAAGGVCLVTADHGNAEQMLEPDGVSPHTAHTTNPVPLVVTSDAFRAP